MQIRTSIFLSPADILLSVQTVLSEFVAAGACNFRRIQLQKHANGQNLRTTDYAIYTEQEGEARDNWALSTRNRDKSCAADFRIVLDKTLSAVVTFATADSRWVHHLRQGTRVNNGTHIYRASCRYIYLPLTRK